MKTLRRAALAALLLLPCNLWAQTTSGSDDLRALLYAGKEAVPATLADLDGTWWQARLSLRGAKAAPAAGLPPSAASSLNAQPAAATVCFTKGRTVTIGGRTYLVAFRPEPKALDYARLVANDGRRPPAAEATDMLDMLMPKLTPDMPLALLLLEAQDIAGLTDIRPFDAKAAASQRVAPSSQTGVMAALLFPVFSRAREKARETSSLSNLKQLGTAVMMYSQDYDELLPPLKSHAAAYKALYPYAKNRDIFVHPGTKAPYRTNPGASGKSLAVIEAPAKFVLFYEAQPASDGTRGVTFADGHAARVSEDEWQRLKRASGIP